MAPTPTRIRRIARPIVGPIARFLEIEAAGGILLLAATVAAVGWANSPWQASYDTFWDHTLRLEIGSYVFEEDLVHLVNDLLMAFFFFVVGAEIKRELVEGELRDRRAVGLPVLAALGGMVVPAGIYLLFNGSGDASAGWGIPMATDIAFATAVVGALGSRVPSAVKVLLLTLAIVDDLGAIVVIAAFYTDDLDARFLLAAAVITVGVHLLHRTGRDNVPLLVIAGAGLWFTIFESGVHATIAGVIMGVLLPASRTGDPALDELDESPCDRAIESFHPWTSYLVIPIFALANAGIELTSATFGDPSSVLVGVAVGLVAGKFLGIAAFSWLAVRSGIGRLPADARWAHVLGVGAVAGIGFTVSLFITGLAFDDELLQADAKTGTFAASIVAAVAGAALLHRAGRSDQSSSRAASREAS